MKRKVLLSLIIIFTLSFVVISYINKSYSYGLTLEVTGKYGSRVLTYYDGTTGDKIDFESAKTYYGVPYYTYYIDATGTIYFYKDKEIPEIEYEIGLSKEEADDRAIEYGKNGIRVTTTDEFISKLDDIYDNKKIGSFYFEYSKYDEIDFAAVNTYFNSKYALMDPHQNFYDYEHKGPQEPLRFKDDIKKEAEEFFLDTRNIRLSLDEQKKAEQFANSIIYLLQGDNTDYQKILRTYTFLRDNSTYFDDKMHDDLIEGYTSIYDGLINQQTTCIGYSIMFSYLMDKMGIESYIVDNIEYIDVDNKEFMSSHSWNMVKLSNKYYKVDLTSGVFLSGINQSEIYQTMDISTTAYGKSTTTDISNSYYKINELRNVAKNMQIQKTTTTNAIRTTKEYPYEIPNTTFDKNKTTIKRNTQPVENFRDVKTKKYTERPLEIESTKTTDKNGEGGFVVSTESNPTTSNPKTEKKVNIIKQLQKLLIPALVIGLGILLFINRKRIFRRQVSINTIEAQEILNKSITNNESREETNEEKGN